MPDASVASLARYPVKSLRGERVDELALEGRGAVGDRAWAVYTADGGIGSGKNSRRFRHVDGLLDWSARVEGAQVVLRSPAGREAQAGSAEADALLSEALGQPLSVRREADVSHFDDSPLHAVTTSSHRALESWLGGPVDLRRFRANLVLDVDGSAFVDARWIGRTIRVGDAAVLSIPAAMPRCVMVNAASGELARDGRILKTLGEHTGTEFGVMVEVLRPGVVRQGDPVHPL